MSVTLAGCGGTAILDPSQMSNFIDVGIVNETAVTVSVRRCYNQRCSFHDVSDSIRPGRVVHQAFNNGVGINRLRFATKGKADTCISLHYAAGAIAKLMSEFHERTLANRRGR